MAGLRTSVETCYGRAGRTLKKSAIQYCYLLDQLASSADAAMMRNFNLKMPQDVFWQSQSALARTMAVMMRIQPDPEVNSRIIQSWAPLLSISRKELASLSLH